MYVNNPGNSASIFCRNSRGLITIADWTYTGCAWDAIRVDQQSGQTCTFHIENVWIQACRDDAFENDDALAGAIKNCRWYERGLLHPFLDYDEVPAYLNSLVDPMDDQGFVHLSQKPGLGEDINFEYIQEHRIEHY
jgi:hypothetical protein